MWGFCKVDMHCQGGAAIKWETEKGRIKTSPRQENPDGWQEKVQKSMKEKERKMVC